MAHTGPLGRTREIPGLRGLPLRREVLEEVRHTVSAMGTFERRGQAVLVVEVCSDDVSATLGESACGVRRRVARQCTASVPALRVVKDRARQSTTLCAGGTHYRDQLFVRH